MARAHKQPLDSHFAAIRSQIKEGRIAMLSPIENARFISHSRVEHVQIELQLRFLVSRVTCATILILMSEGVHKSSFFPVPAACVCKN